MAAVRHMDLLGAYWDHPQHTKFRKDRSNRCGDIAIFVIFQMAAAAMLNFQKFEILTVFRCRGPICVITPNFIKIGQTAAKILRFNGSQNGGRPPSWICWAPIGTTRNDFWMVSIAVQNFVDMDAVVLIT